MQNKKNKALDVLKNPMGKLIYVDMDNTLCDGTYWLDDKQHPPVNEDYANLVRYLDDKGAFITIWTARPIKAFTVTYKWLGANNLMAPIAMRYKGPCDLMLDDKCLNADDVLDFIKKHKLN